MRNQLEGQLSLFDTDLELGGTGHWTEKVFGKIGCHNCACNRMAESYRTGKACEHWELGTCPVVKQRKPEDNLDRDIDPTDERYMSSICFGCGRCLPNPKNGAFGAGETWRPHIHHRYMCQHYRPSTKHTEPCLLYPIQVWNLPDGTKKKWCAVCEANGCEDCYKQWEAAQEFLENYEED